MRPKGKCYHRHTAFIACLTMNKIWKKKKKTKKGEVEVEAEEEEEEEKNKNQKRGQPRRLTL